jgi:hypothetical protein
MTEIDQVIEDYEEHQAEEVAEEDHRRVEREAFVRHAEEVIDTIIRPAMHDAAERLKRDGAGGRIDESPADYLRPQRITLWMSLDGPVGDEPRQDLNPYLQLGVDVPNRRIDLWEGDMWHKLGASRQGEPWDLGEITTEKVAECIVVILRRAAEREDSP